MESQQALQDEHSEEESLPIEEPQPTEFGIPTVFDYEELQDATNFFNPSQILGKGGYGVVYRGKLSDGRAVAIKEIYVRNQSQLKQFMNEIKIIPRLHHKNLVSLYGWTNPEDEKLLLVYEFVPKGTLTEHLHQKRFSNKALTWAQRIQIAMEIAQALVYLHSFESPIIHRDVKPDNILLDENFNVKLADFGTCRLLLSEGTHTSTMPQGTQGYLDPEYNLYYRLTSKSDVFSFGVVLLELISGKLALDLDADEVWLVNRFNKMENTNLEQIIDPELGCDQDSEITTMVNTVGLLAYKCLQTSGDMRPSMMEALTALKRIKDGKQLQKTLMMKQPLPAIREPAPPPTIHEPAPPPAPPPAIREHAPPLSIKALVLKTLQYPFLGRNPIEEAIVKFI